MNKAKTFKNFTVYIFEFDDHFEAEVDGLTVKSFGTAVPKIKNERVVFVHSNKKSLLEQIVSALNSLGYYGNLKLA